MYMMKTIFVLACCLAALAACKKDLGACRNYNELSSQQGHLVDLNGINAPELLDTLAKYPQLQLYSFNTLSYGWNAQCHLVYQGLLVFSDNYSLFKSAVTGSLTASGTAPFISTAISLEPAVSYKDAIAEAKKHANFDHSCISYQLGLYNINGADAAVPKNYRLVWKVQSETGYPFVILDARDKWLMASSNGGYFLVN